MGIGTTSPQAKLEIKGTNDGGEFVALHLRNAGGDGSDVTINMISSTDQTNTAARSFIKSERVGSGSELTFGTVNQERMRIDSSGNVQIPNDTGKLQLGASQDLAIYHDGTDSIIDNNTGNLNLVCDSAQAINLRHGSENMIRAITDGAAELYYDNVKKLETASNGITLNDGLLLDNATNAGRDVQWQPSNDRLAFLDNTKATFGNAVDLQIYHDGSNSFIDDTGTGNLVVRSSTIAFENAPGGGEVLAKFIGDGATELYFDNSKKLATTTDGIQLFGNGYIDFPDNGRIRMGAGFDLAISHDGTNNRIEGSAPLFLRTNNLLVQNGAGTEGYMLATENGSVVLYFDNSPKLETTSTGVSFNDGNITNVGTIALDSIKGDADDNTNITFATNDVITFKCGSTSPALTVNTTQVKVEDNQKFVAGTGNDLQIYHDGTFNRIASDVRTDIIKITSSEHLAKFIPDGAVELFYDNSKKLETTSVGVSVSAGNLDLGDNQFIRLGDSADLQLFHNGSNSFIDDTGTGNLVVRSSTIAFENAPGGGEVLAKFIGDGATELYFDNEKKLHTTAGGVVVTGDFATTGSGGTITANENIKISNDTGKLLLGSSNDLQIYHNGTNSYIDNNTGALVIDVEGNTQFETNSFFVLTNDNENAIRAFANGAVELYYDNSKKLATDAAGITVTGNIYTDGNVNLTADNKKVRFGAGEDLQIYHDGTNDRIDSSGSFLILEAHNHVFRNPAGNEDYAKFLGNGAVELYFNNSKKLETTSTGVEVDGQLEIDGSVGETILKSSGAEIEFTRAASSNITCSHASGSLKIITGGSDSMLIDSSGSLLIGGTSSIGAAHKLQVFDDTDVRMIIANTTAASSQDATLFFAPANNVAGAEIKCTSEEDFSTSANRTARLSFSTRKDGTLSEQMRIDSSGNLLKNTTSTITPSSQSDTGFQLGANNQAIFMASGGPPVLIARNGSTGEAVRFGNQGTANVGSIDVTTSSTSYNTSSDYRLKENVTAISDGITRLKTLKPYRFNFKSEPDRTVDGFFAHEVTAVPEAITGIKDETQDILYTEEDTIPSDKKVGDVKETVPKYQGIDQSKLVPLLVAAVQELTAKVEALEAS